MKKIFITLAAVILSAGLVSAQDMAKATETAQTANEAFQSGDKSLALTGFKEALTLASACGEDGAELVSQCKNGVAQVMLSLAKDSIKGNEFDSAISQLKETIATATEYGIDEVVSEATTLIPQVFMTKGTNLLKEKNFAGAAEAYKAVLESDPENGNAALRLGQALMGAGKAEDAIAAFEQAAKNGQEETAKKQISNIYLKQAAGALKTKAYAGAVENALKANEYGDNAQAFLIAGQASQQLSKNADAIKYFEKYLELAPTAKNSNAIAFTVAALYQKAGNKAKATEFYTKVQNDPQLGAQAKQQLGALK